MNNDCVSGAEFRFRCTAVLLALVPTAMALLSSLNNISGAQGTLLHVVYPMLGMTETFGNPLQTWRAIDSRTAGLAIFALVGLAEMIPGLLGAIAISRMVRSLRAERLSFRRAVQDAQWAMLLSIFVWLFFFGVGAGDWFLVWQSPGLKAVWTDAFQYSGSVAFILFGISLIDARLRDGDFL